MLSPLAGLGAWQAAVSPGGSPRREGGGFSWAEEGAEDRGRAGGQPQGRVGAGGRPWGCHLRGEGGGRRGEEGEQ